MNLPTGFFSDWKIIFKGLVIAMVFTIVSSPAHSQDPDFYIFLCFGQSNMEGQGSIGLQDKTVDSRFQVFQAVNCGSPSRMKGKWYSAVPPLTRCYTGLSPTDYFGRTFVETLPEHIRVGVINVSVAGCKIELFDQDQYQSYASTAPDWMKSIISGYGGNPYQYLVDLAKLAQKDGVIKGILLHQGESNTGDQQWPGKVRKIYQNLLEDLELDPDSVPLLAGEMVHHDQGGACASMNSIIAKLPQVIPNAHVISSSGCTDMPDNLHFSSAGYRELGRRYGVQMLSLLGYDISTGSSQLHFGDGFLLEQNFPNPAFGSTTITFEVPVSGDVSMRIYNQLGREVAILTEKMHQPGKHHLTFDSSRFPAGTYFYVMRAGEVILQRKMIVLSHG